MSVAIRAITQIQEADDAPVLGAGQDGYALTWDNASGAFVATALFTGGLLATGATAGATSQAQAFTNGIVGPTWKPASDSTTALQLQNAAGTAVVTVDTTNGKLITDGIGRYTSAASNTKLEFVTLDLNSYGSQIDFIYGSTLKHMLRAYKSGSTYLVDVHDASGRSPWVIIPASGFMGVNKLMPTAHLHVNNEYPQVGIQVDVVDWAEKTAFQIYMPDYSAPTLVFTTHGGAVFNERGLDTDFRVEGDTVTHLLFVDGSADRVGIGASSPDSKLHVQLDDAATNAASQLLTLSHNTSGTAAAGYGSRVLWELESSTTADQTAAALDVSWNDATHATRKADLILTAYDSGGEREGLRIRGAGSEPAIGFYGVAPVARAVLATGAGATVDNVITALQNLGLVKQS